MKARTVNMFLAGAALALGLASSAGAADPGFCHDYAHAAMDQVHRAMDHHRCHYLFDNGGGRWNSDWHAHYNWCLGVSRDQAWGEREARRRALDDCAHW
jgi:hypothetical protein